MSSFFETLTKPFVIAEIGINHNGDVTQAKRLIKAAVDAGTDAVKLQVRDLEALYTKAVLDDPLKAEHGTQYLLHELRKADLSYDKISELKKYADALGTMFFATPFEKKSANFLESLQVPIYKIGSPDFTNLPLIDTVIGFGKPILLSTGMSEESEIREVVAFLREKKADFALLHCNSTYPASYIDINLKFIRKLHEISGVCVGYSGHERGFGPTLCSLAFGAQIIERHITFDVNSDGPDHSSSLTPAEFEQMVSALKGASLSIGSALKVYNQGEQTNRIALGKSLVATKDLKQGHVLRAEDLEAKTPAKGVSPLELKSFLGRPLCKDLSREDYIFPGHVSDKSDEARSSFDFKHKWGIVGRLNDFEDLLEVSPELVEIHLTWRDLVGFSSKASGLKQASYSQDLVVHAPEYFRDELIDFSTNEKDVIAFSVEMLQKTIDLARSLAPFFKGQTDPRGPRVIVHPGGHFTSPSSKYNKTEQYQFLMKHLRELDSEGVQILVENMPPFPWYFGGQWYNTVFLDPKEIAQFAKEMGWGICYDTSHALLFCNHAGITIQDFSKTIYDHISYLHISDALGSTQEGLQLGQGNLDLLHVAELVARLNVGFVPEIWQGHLNRGHGFKRALETLEGLLKKSSSPSCSEGHSHDHSNVLSMKEIKKT